MTAEIVPHDVEWTAERVKRFWDHYSSNPALRDTYFAGMVGRSLLAFVRKRIRIGQAIDIGCGPGDLIGYLLEQGHQAQGADSSLSSVEEVKRRFAGRQRFGGASLMGGSRIPLESSAIDTAFLLEVVEHMDDEALRSALSEAARILRRNGHVVLTTPNEEDLAASRTMCPECGCIFHRVQHVRSWSAASLRQYLESAGFETVTCAATVLSPYGGLLGWPYRIAYPLIRKGRPHLVYIGRKP